MSNEIIAAIIAGGAAIVAAIVGGLFVIKKRKHNESHSNEGIRITNNRNSKMSKTEISGNVEIDSNKDLDISEGKINGTH